MTRLNDTQLTILSAAAQRGNHAIAPPDSLSDDERAKLAKALLRKALVEEVLTKGRMPVHRIDAEGGKLSLVVTAAGLAAIGVTDEPSSGRFGAAPSRASLGEGSAERKGWPKRGGSGDAIQGSRRGRRLPRQACPLAQGECGAPSAQPDGHAPRPGSKLATVIALLARADGAGIEELMAATEWLAHTTRAALTGLRRRGYAVTRERGEAGASVYRIAAGDFSGSGGLTMSAATISHRPGASRADAAPVEAELASLERLDIGDLRLRWRNRFGRTAPANLPRHLLVRLYAYRIQVEAHGGLTRESERLLSRMASNKGDAGGRIGDMKPGTLLSREWQGRLEQVMAMKEGFAWQGRTFQSLSAVATAITGTRWNGRRFFGLPDSKAARPRPSPGKSASGTNATVGEDLTELAVAPLAHPYKSPRHDGVAPPLQAMGPAAALTDQAARLQAMAGTAS